MRPDDPYSRVDYRRLIAWPERIEREWPFLRGLLPASGRVLDLGCGTGEHSRFLASKGYDVTGIDSSPAMLAKAVEAALPVNLRFLPGDIADVAALTTGSFEAAICVGNTLPHLTEDSALRRLLGGLRMRLRPGAPLLLQVLNYERILGKGIRSLPLNFRGEDEAGGEIVFLRVMTPLGGGRLVFTPTTLRYRPQGDPPIEVVTSRNVELRAWTHPELDAALREAGFETVESYGTVGDVPYAPMDSTDAVLVAR
jgi:glycine/sarcosine N-methyltransferase